MSDPVCPLCPGVHVWLWPRRGWGRLDVPAVAAELRGLGIAGVIPHASLTSPAWIARHAGPLRDAGLQVSAGLGLDGKATLREPGAQHRIAGAIVAALDAAPDGTAHLDWEKRYDNGRRAFVRGVVEEVLVARPQAAERTVDCPWWAPLHGPPTRRGKRGGATHPSAPTREWGALCKWRWVQAYGAVGKKAKRYKPGRSARMLAWARDASQYPALGTPAERVLPAVQGYRRGVRDHVAMLLAEPVVCLWSWLEVDAECRLALAVVRELRVRGFVGPGAVRAFQAAAGLVVDGLVGPLTARALELSVPDGVRWRGES